MVLFNRIECGQYWTMMKYQSGPIAADQSRQEAVFAQIRDGILSGALPAGGRLPATRQLADELSVARQTVVIAYERLAAEGYVTARVGNGTFVTEDLPDSKPADRAPPPAVEQKLSRRGAAMAEIALSAVAVEQAPVPPDHARLLAPGVPASELFPAAAWASCAAKVLRAMPPGLAGYPDPQGLPALRQQIAAHLAATRGLIADPDRIVVTSGTQQALRVAADLLIDPGDPAWVENPGYIAGRGALLAAGARLVAVPSDADGMDIAAGIALAPEARLALVAPSHATPLGGALPIGRRLALLDWAEQSQAWLLEDDCDSEFRWEGKPLPPLASLHGGGRVIYCGSFSKTLAPALRLGFAVLPQSLMRPFLRVRGLTDRGPAVLSQAVLAEFMGQGLLGPHIRRMRTEYGRRRAALLAAFARYCPELRPMAAPGGLHLVGLLPEDLDEARVFAAARRRGLLVSPLRAYFLGEPRFGGLVMGFAGTPVARAGEAARELAAAMGAR
jgi:GntR family transcriptional regulator/MocR family aminotransferase